MENDNLIPPHKDAVDRRTASHSDSSRHHFSRATYILIYSIFPLTLILILYISPLTAALLPVLVTPTIWLFLHDRQRCTNERKDPQTFLWTYILTGTVGVTVVVITQYVLSYLCAAILFGSEIGEYMDQFSKSEKDLTESDPAVLARRREMAMRWQYWVFLLLLAFVFAAVIEECLKYSALILARRYGRVIHERNYVTIVMAGALGFSIIENIGFVYATVQAGQGAGQLALTLLERVVIASPMHALGAVVIGINVIRRDVYKHDLNLMHVLGLPVLIHGTFDFGLFAVSALNGNVGWVHPHGGWLLVALVWTIFMMANLAVIMRRRVALMKECRPKFL
ncbi:uncharacterized protein BCR38DRAFT_440811 [Pseudomassariella vexata]|uniref:PrsW family intramembrane metalloprotease n=1 Tax=Pseudomassariella vexata TaxID=1141098 RepID=A0A1Y2DR92_9PEZI|nr:uncharacterized protein BCR38DRAFT_440811 [Pseudomassariella vexata]ORY61654.1 hypothetical protein BCR38DRAFT_440811 [Pseudomassariella vexata]